MNKCHRVSGICFQPFQDLSSVTCSLLYSTFSDNNATEYICIYFERSVAVYEMKCCNILRNTQVILHAEGTIRSAGNLTIADSCILENNANYIFYAYSTITLSNCTVDSTNHTVLSGGFIIQNTVTKHFILGLNHMSTRNCHSEYDSAITPTAIPYVSRPTKKAFWYIGKKNHYKSRISDFISFNYLFIFTFIHPDPSGDCWCDFD